MNKKTTVAETSKTSRKGEGFLQSTLSQFALLYKVDGGQDVGIDYFAEWTPANSPTSILFAIQLKTRTVKNKKSNQGTITLSSLHKKDFNGLTKYKITPIEIKPETIAYWKSFEIPIYLFIVAVENQNFKIFYKRYTPVLHGTQEDNNEFYLVSDKSNFLGFKNDKAHFARDLFVDYLRCNYMKGTLLYKSPQDFGFADNELEDKIFDLIEIPIYKKQIEKNLFRLDPILPSFYSNYIKFKNLPGYISDDGNLTKSTSEI